MARTSAFSTADSLRAAQMYYLQDLTMDAIARESGLVEVQIRAAHNQIPALAQTLREHDRADVHVVPMPDTLNEGEARAGGPPSHQDHRPTRGFRCRHWPGLGGLH